MEMQRQDVTYQSASDYKKSTAQLQRNFALNCTIHASYILVIFANQIRGTLFFLKGNRH